MEKNRGLKIISIVGLCLGIVSLAIGFANYSSMLKISSGADVGTSGGTFKVEFSTLKNLFGLTPVICLTKTSCRANWEILQ